MNKVHELKTWPVEFRAVKDGIKTWEFRRDDRGYQVGDTLRLQEWNPAFQEYTGNSVDMKITYILHGGPYNIPETHCIMSIVPQQLDEPQRTNGDAIRAMNDEELANHLSGLLVSKFEWDIDPHYILEYLKLEVKGNG